MPTHFRTSRIARWTFYLTLLALAVYYLSVVYLGLIMFVF